VTGQAVDVHGHSVPRAFLDEVVRGKPYGVQAELTEGRYVVTFPGAKPLRPVAGVMLDTTDRTAWFGKQEIAHQVVAPWLDVHGQDLPAADGAAWVRLLNDAMAESVADPARHLSAHATLHLADPEAAATELRRAVQDLGMRSAMIPVALPVGRLSDPGFDALWATASELDTPIVLHPPTQAPSNELMARFPALKGLFGRQIDSTLATAELIMTGVFDRFPGLRLVVVHGGGFLPYQAARFDRDAKGGEPGRRLPSDVVRSLYYDTVLLSPAAVRFLYDYVGSERVVIGSDFGAAPAQRAGVRVTAAVREAGDDPAVTDAVLAGNAHALFRLA
jgi:aminocarboxymuconate-semialdehyde decarboxylase